MREFIGNFSRGLITAKFSGDLAAGQMVKLSAAGEVALAADGEKFFGQCKVVEDDGYCGVEKFDLLEAEYTGSDPAVGIQRFLASSEGKVKLISTDALALNDGTVADSAVTDLTVNENGVEVEVVDVDTTANKVWFFIR